MEKNQLLDIHRVIPERDKSAIKAYVTHSVFVMKDKDSIPTRLSNAVLITGEPDMIFNLNHIYYSLPSFELTIKFLFNENEKIKALFIIA